MKKERKKEKEKRNCLSVSRRYVFFSNILNLQDQAGRKVGVKDQTGHSPEFEDFQKSESKLTFT